MIKIAEEALADIERTGQAGLHPLREARAARHRHGDRAVELSLHDRDQHRGAGPDRRQR
jgi:hypothetical protein